MTTKSSGGLLRASVAGELPVHPLSVALGLLREAEARLNQLSGNWGPEAGKPGALVERIRDFLGQHGRVAGGGR